MATIILKSKLTPSEREQLQSKLRDQSFTCGAQLQDLKLEERLSDVCVREFTCHDPIEKLYYSAKYEQLSTDPHFYPQCDNCRSREPIKKS